MWSNRQEKQLTAHEAIKEWVQNRWEVDMMLQNLYVSQRGGFATIEGKVLAHKHRFKNKKARTNCDSEWV